MSGEDKHDELLLNILKEEGQIIPFLNSIFGFLYRRTDFYIVKENEDGKVGFLPGVSEMAVRDTFRKWQRIATGTTNRNQESSMESYLADIVIHEEEVMTTDYETELITEQPTEKQKTSGKPRLVSDDLSSDTYNGADCGNYRWSQTAVELDIKVPVPERVTRAGDVRVEVGASRVAVAVRDVQGQWVTLLDGDLSHKHLREESIWTLMPGKHLSIHLQKAGERWWDSLLKTESKLDTSRFDVSRHVSELPEDDQMQVEKMLVREEQKRLGILPQEHQDKVEMLKKAWNAEGSPFQGQPFDPSVLQLPQE